jgi:hypothetical protein
MPKIYKIGNHHEYSTKHALNVTPNPMVNIHANRPKLFTAKRFVDTKNLAKPNG